MSRDLELEHRVTKVEEACAMLPRMAEQLNQLVEKQAKFEGRWGTLVMLGSALWAVLCTWLAWYKGH